MQKREPGSTLLDEVIRTLGLRPGEIVETADRIARETSVPSISRAQLHRLRLGTGTASETKIYIVVAALREVTGILFAPSQLFALEPAAAGPPAPFPRHGDVLPFPMSSDRAFVTL